jgi:hypothetical protein
MKTGFFPPPDHDVGDTPYRRLNFHFAYEWLENVTGLNALLAHMDSLQRADPEHRYLCTLDDPGQCSYTSGHAAQNERLELDSPDDMDWENPAQLAAWELAGLQHRVQQLCNPDIVQTWADVCGTLSIGADDVKALVAANAEPDQLLDEVIYIQRLPVATDDLKIAGQPNGYFSVDWDTFQNHAIIRHLQARWDYRFFGMGAAWMGFVRASPLNADETRRMVSDLRDLYGSGQDSGVWQHEGWATLAHVLQARNTLMLGYIEGLADNLGIGDT